MKTKELDIELTEREQKDYFFKAVAIFISLFIISLLIAFLVGYNLGQKNKQAPKTYFATERASYYFPLTPKTSNDVNRGGLF